MTLEHRQATNAYEKPPGCQFSDSSTYRQRFRLTWRSSSAMLNATDSHRGSTHPFPLPYANWRPKP